jgi:sulfatase maturation enzyme AslB (radical SAM superfamily)
MRCLNCRTSNITVPLIGRVAYGGIPTKQRSDYMLVVRASDKPDAKGYRAVITDGSNPHIQERRIPLVCVDGLTSFCEGDILSVEPDTGTIKFLYEVNSRANVIFVTEKCNCACVMCPQPPGHESESRTEFNCELIRLMAPGPMELALTGGEPTLVGQRHFATSRCCKSASGKAIGHRTAR